MPIIADINAPSPNQPDASQNGATSVSAIWIVSVMGIATGLVAADPSALLIVPLELTSALIVIGPGVLGGLWLVPLFRLGPLPFRWHLVLGAALGLGSLSLVVLGLGLAGWLSGSVGLVLLTLLSIAGLLRLRHLIRANAKPAGTARFKPASPPGIARFNPASPVLQPIRRDPFGWLWLAVCPFAVLGLLAAVTPPGLIWSEEGFGYDVLEYHLQLPKEYALAGAIQYAPHNVYANFPSNVEMLYLLAMLTHGDTVETGPTANMIHFLLGALTVFAAWAIGRDWGVRAGVTAGVIAATTGWLTYLSGLAYVEHGLLFFGLTAAGLILRHWRREQVPPAIDRPRRPSSDDRAASPEDLRLPPGILSAELRHAALAGVLSGFACGCKYTAVAFVGLPLALVCLLAPNCTLKQRMAAFGIFVLASGLSFSPWLIKNVAMTGNPVFPLLNHYFDATPPGWSVEQTAQWNAAHTLSRSDDAAQSRWPLLWHHGLGDKYQRLHWAAVVLALWVLWARKPQAVELALGGVLLVQVAVWLLATHLFARFAVPMLIPLILLSACAASKFGCRKGLGIALAACVLLASAWHFTVLTGLFRQEWPGVVPSAVVHGGRVPGYEYLGFVNHELEPDAEILLCGEARGFYFKRQVACFVPFSRNPFYETLIDSAADSRAAWRWLSNNGFTHVLINWSEVRRISRTYGSAPPMTEKQLQMLLQPLRGNGLERIREYAAPRFGPGAPYVELFRVRARK